MVYGFILEAPAYSWYYTPFALSIALFIALSIEGVYRLLCHINTLPRWIIWVVIYAALLIADSVFPLVGLKQPIMPTYENYKNATEWLNANAKEGASVGSSDIGILRFFYEKGTVFDGAGLVNPEILAHLKRRDFDWYVQHYQPDYLLYLHPPRPHIDNMVYEDWFKQEYTIISIFRSRGYASALYERQKP